MTSKEYSKMLPKFKDTFSLLPPAIRENCAAGFELMEVQMTLRLPRALVELTDAMVSEDPTAPTLTDLVEEAIYGQTVTKSGAGASMFLAYGTLKQKGK